MGEFREEFRKMCRDDENEACLTALSILTLRHISEKDKYTEIRSVLKSIEANSPEINKLKEIYNTVSDYDEKLIKILIDIETNIINLSKYKKPNVSIKKWWEA